MATIFVGRVNDQGRKWLAAAPIIAGGFQQAGDALRQYQLDQEDQRKQKMMDAALVAKMSGGWGNTPQEFKNELPDIFDMEFNKDPITGDVVVDKSLDELLNDQLRRRVMADPEMAMNMAMTNAKLMKMQPHPAEVELATQELVGNLAAKRYSADLKAEGDALKDRRARERLAIKHGYDMERIFANNALKSEKDDSFSGLYQGPGGKLVPESVKVEMENAGEDVSGFHALSLKRARPALDLYRAETSRANQESQAAKRNLDVRISTQRLAGIIAGDPARMALLQRLRKELEDGDTKGAEETRRELAGFTAFAAQEAGVDPENFNASILEMFKFFQDKSGVESLLRAATQRKIDAATGLGEPQDPNVIQGDVGGVKFKATRVK